MDQNESRAHLQILGLAGAAFVLVFIFWQAAAETQLLYPFRLLVTFVHEAGHGLSALLTGGRFLNFQVLPGGAGFATTVGGNRVIITSMGYVGAALFGAALLYLTNRTARVKLVALLTGAFFIGVALLFTGKESTLFMGGMAVTVILWAASGWLDGQTQGLSYGLRLASIGAAALTLVMVWGDIALMTGVVTGSTLFALAAFGSPRVVTFCLNVLALLVGFNAFADLIGLLNNQSARLGNVPNDAVALANLTGLPATVWILIWLALSMIMMGAAVYYGLIQPIRRTD